jgi:hypothetical protein
MNDSTPLKYYMANRNHQMGKIIREKLEADKFNQSITPDIFRRNQHIIDNGSKIAIPATLNQDGTAKNYLGYYLDTIKYTHPINCIETPCYKEPNGNRGYIMPIRWYEKQSLELYKSITDSRPPITFNQIGLQVSPTVKYFAITITFFYSIL